MSQCLTKLSSSTRPVTKFPYHFAKALATP
jgi:hypothetical protein